MKNLTTTVIRHGFDVTVLTETWTNDGETLLTSTSATYSFNSLQAGDKLETGADAVYLGDDLGFTRIRDDVAGHGKDWSAGVALGYFLPRGAGEKSYGVAEGS